MITYMVRREIEGIGLSGKSGKELALARSTEVVAHLERRVDWCHSWAGADTLWSLYRARSAADVHEHARQAGLPPGQITRVLMEIPGDRSEWLRICAVSRDWRIA